jgi:hypothetical protein
MNKFKVLTYDKLRSLPSGTVLLLQQDCHTEPKLAMVLRGACASRATPTNVYSGQTWGNMEGLELSEVLEIWCPLSNKDILPYGGVTTSGKYCVYRQDTAKKDKIATLKLQAAELQKTIESLEG